MTTLNKEKLHKEILEKFGTLSKFCRLSGHNRYLLQKFFARKSADELELLAIYELYKATNVTADKGHITPLQIKALQKALKQAGGVYQFCKKNKKFSGKSLYQILDGRRKRMTKKVKQVFDHFEIDLK